MNVIFWAAVVTFILGAPRVFAPVVQSFTAANKRIEADRAFYWAIPTDIDPEWVEK